MELECNRQEEVSEMNTQDLFGQGTPPSESVTFAPTRKAGLERLEKFLSRTGHHYERNRNYDFGPEQRSNISVLSPWIRHRIITEQEVLTQTLARQSPSSAEKFVQEVFWRGYFKGWLEQHPSVWLNYKRDLVQKLDALEANSFLNAEYQTAIEGRTGIDCFDQWARELVETGYLHNHKRMWFASIWVFTLGLPWQLGADFFMQHLLDGDPASNTCSWRWVSGLHTKGKSYLARASNIAKFTDGRFNPVGQLSPTAVPLVEDFDHPLLPIPEADALPEAAFLLLLTPEDCQASALWAENAAAVLALPTPEQERQSIRVQAFKTGALQDSISDLNGTLLCADWVTQITEVAREANVKHIVTAYTPIGPSADQLATAAPSLTEAGLTLHRVRRPYDTLTWPHANKGFFKVKKQIPKILQGLGLAP